MSCHKNITNLLAVCCVLALSGVSAVHAAEVQPALSDEPSLFERYRSGAKDLILKGLELTGIKYRRGGTDADSGLDCSGFVQLVFKDALGMLLPRTAKEQSQVGDVIDKKNSSRATSYSSTRCAAPSRTSASISVTTASCTPRARARKFVSRT